MWHESPFPSEAKHLMNLRCGHERLLYPLKDAIKEMLEKGYIGARIYIALKSIGYRASLSSVNRYIAEVKRSEKINGLATTRVETALQNRCKMTGRNGGLP